MNEQLKKLIELAAERIVEDYGGGVADFAERYVCVKELLVDEITFNEKGDNTFRYYHWNGASHMKVELFPTEEEEYKILDEFYAWY